MVAASPQAALLTRKGYSMNTQSKARIWIAWGLTGLIGLMLIMSAIMKFINPPMVSDELNGKYGYPEDLTLFLGIVELCCVLLYLFPRTAVLGAVLLTGYLGGAVATHLRVGDNFAGPALIGIFVWLALHQRDPRVRALLPWRPPLPTPESHSAKS
jgi:hypothetical protein